MGFTQKRKAKSKDEKKLHKSNQSKVRRAHKLLELQKEQLARTEGDFFYDNRNYIYSRLEYEPPKKVISIILIANGFKRRVLSRKTF